MPDGHSGVADWREMQARVTPSYDPANPLVADKVAAAANSLRANYARFAHYARRAEAELDAGDLHSALANVAIAASTLTHRHGGTFASPRLERVINLVGRRLGDVGASLRVPPQSSGDYKRILHVGTEVSPVGGLTRMISRWMLADEGRNHSFVLTRHKGDVPDHLTRAIEERGGQLYRLNRQRGDILDWARTLREIGRKHDLIIFHIHCEDVIPLLAFADPAHMPPVLFLNHADHLFWLGTATSHLTISLRDAAIDICRDRRGIPAERNILLPTIVDRVPRQHSKAEARAELGIPDDGPLLISVARGPKYRSMNGVSYADLHRDLLLKHPKARLMVVGAGAQPDWQAANIATNGRIVALPEQPDPWRYFEAADIYLDSFPFVSSTSMMEAANYGLPQVSLFLAPDGARIFGINHVGLCGTSLIARSLQEYNDLVDRLLRDENYRLESGKAVQEAVWGAHTPPGWREWLEKVYARAAELPVLDPAEIYTNASADVPQFGEPDIRHEDIFGYDLSIADMTKDVMGLLATGARLKQWQELAKQKAFRSASEACRLLLPEWVKRRVKG